MNRSTKQDSLSEIREGHNIRMLEFMQEFNLSASEYFAIQENFKEGEKKLWTQQDPPPVCNPARAIQQSFLLRSLPPATVCLIVAFVMCYQRK